MNKVEIGKRIRRIRKNLGDSMTKFGERIDKNSPIKSGVISNWENGKQLPNNERLKRIAELGDVSVDYLLNGVNKKLIEIGNEYYTYLLSTYPEETHSGKALRYFDDESTKNLIISSIKQLFNIPYLSKSINSLEDLEGEQEKYSSWMLETFNAEYVRNHISNTNLIHSIREEIAGILLNLEDSLKEKEVQTINPDLTKFPSLKNSFIRVKSIEKHLNPALIDDLHILFNKVYSLLAEFETKYPDQKLKSNDSQIYQLIDYDLSALGSTVIKTFEVNGNENLETYLNKNLDFILSQYANENEE